MTGTTWLISSYVNCTRTIRLIFFVITSLCQSYFFSVAMVRYHSPIVLSILIRNDSTNEIIHTTVSSWASEESELKQYELRADTQTATRRCVDRQKAYQCLSTWCTACSQLAQRCAWPCPARLACMFRRQTGGPAVPRLTTSNSIVQYAVMIKHIPPSWPTHSIYWW